MEQEVYERKMKETFNRTKLELKSGASLTAVGIGSAFNRTKLELKLSILPRPLQLCCSFNRTKLELK